MKKTLIALAVLAASGASFAQVAITGSVAFGYEIDHNGTTKSDASGLGNDTSYLQFNASEDIGGGLKASAMMSIDGLTRGGVSGGDSSIALEGGFGKLTLATTKGADYLSGGLATVGGNGLDGKVFSARSLGDSIAYAYTMGAVTLGLSHGEPANVIGLGAGAAGAAAGADKQRSNRVSVRYAGGPLTVDGSYAVYDQAGTTVNNDENNMRAAVSYDLGVAKLGAGVSANKKVSRGTRMDSLVSASVPLGALTLGANFGQRTENDTDAGVAVASAAVGSTRTGYGLNAVYALSKRTSLAAYYTNWKAAATDTENSSYTAVLLSHSF